MEGNIFPTTRFSTLMSYYLDPHMCKENYKIQNKNDILYLCIGDKFYIHQLEIKRIKKGNKYLER